MPSKQRRPNADSLVHFLPEEMKDAGIFSMDLEREITSWCPAIERIFGYRETDFLGQNASMLFTA